MKTCLLTIVLAAAVTSCAVGPDYESPVPDAPAQAPFAGSIGVASFGAEAPRTEWWTLYADPDLTAAIAEALAANTDVRVAAANLERARALALGARRQRLPSTELGTGATGTREPALAPTQPAFEDTTYTYGLDVSYQVDVFGRARRTVEAGRAEAEAAAAAFDVARLTVAAETARAYADACAAAYQRNVARSSTELQRESFELTQRLLDAGRGTAFDVARAAAQLEQTRASIPVFEALHEAALYRLAVLRGQPPTIETQGAATCAAPVRMGGTLPVGDGASLLRRRPDVRQAERTLAGATARIGIATADLYPNVTIGAFAGGAALSFGDLDESESTRLRLGPLLSWNFPNRSAARTRVAVAEANAAAALADFDGTWLNALRETETALSNYTKELSRRDSLAEARRYSAQAAQLADSRFEAGRSNFLDVLQAELTLASSEMALAESDARLANLQITLFLALGGGFEAE